MEIKDLKQDKRNYRKHNDKNISLIKKSVKECGLGRSVVIDKNDEIIAGNGLVSSIPKNTKIKVVETDGSELVVVKRTDLDTNDEKRKKLAIMDNSASDSSRFDIELLTEDFEIPALADMGIEVKEKKEEKEGEVPFTEELLEEHNYIVLYFDNSVDWLQAQSLFELEKKQALGSKENFRKIGIGRVIKGSEALEKVRKFYEK